MAMYIFDIETNAIIHPSKIWMIAIMDVKTDEIEVYVENEVEKGVRKLQDQLVIGHNIAKFDIPILQQFFPWFKPKKIYDTMLLAALIWNDIASIDERLRIQGKLPARYQGKYSLEAFGYRLGVYKGDYGKREDAWEQLTPEMIEYCKQDLRVTKALWDKILTKKDKIVPDALDLETKFAQIIGRQEQYGFAFDLPRALLYKQQIEERMRELEAEFQKIFPPITKQVGTYKNGAPKYKVEVFNPNSRKMIGERLMKLGWKPKEFTPTGQPKISEEILAHIDLEPAKLLLEYLTLAKRLGQLATGKNAWLSLVHKDGRIHGGILTMGTVSHRCAHVNPNMAQVPSNSVWWGKELRSLFIAPEGRKLVGIDASSLELRLFAHYLAPFDGGRYAKKVITDDMHQYHADLLGISRKEAKRFIYAFLYGAGNALLGEILGGTKKDGAKARKLFVEKLPGLNKLLCALKPAKKLGVIKALDGRMLRIRKEHAVLNLLIQSAGAILMKRALVIFDEDLQRKRFKPPTDYEFVNNVHDEWQIEVCPELAETIGEMGCKAITKAGEYYKLKCKFEGEYRMGSNWAETH